MTQGGADFVSLALGYHVAGLPLQLGVFALKRIDLPRFMSTRAQNEKKFGQWDELPDGGRRYRLDVLGWLARYLKDVDVNETTVRFWQEIYDEKGKLVETHEKFLVDKGHQKV